MKRTIETVCQLAPASRQLLLVAVALSWLAPGASAQGFMVWGESGRANEKFGSRPFSGIEYGGGMSFIIGGHSEKRFAVLLPVGFEIRSSTNARHSTDIMGTGDVAFRYKNFSFGPGGNVGYIFRPGLPDDTCMKEIGVVTSCSGNGTERDIGSILAMGISGFAKVNFGPQGRAFLQARYIAYLPSLATVKYPADFANSFASSQGSSQRFPSPEDVPDFRKGRDIRVTAGYVFGKVILRAMYIRQQFDFSTNAKTAPNPSVGLWGQRSNIITGGIGFAF